MRPRFRALEAPRRGFLCSGGNSLVQQVAPPAEDMADEALIEDTTTPEVLAQEAAVLAGTAPDVVEVPEAPAADTPAEPAATPEAQAAPTATETPPAPQPRTYTEEEVRQFRDSARGRIEAERRQAEEARRALREVNREAMGEAALRQEEARLAPTMGADEARSFVRDPARVSAVRENATAKDELRALREQWAARDEDIEGASRVIFARLVTRENNLTAEDQEILATIGTPEGMEKTAKILGQRKTAKVKETADRRAQVPAETKATSLESGISGSSSPESDEARLERINRTPSWEWSDADYKYMKGH